MSSQCCTNAVTWRRHAVSTQQLAEYAEAHLINCISSLSRLTSSFPVSGCLASKGACRPARCCSMPFSHAWCHSVSNSTRALATCRQCNHCR